MTRARVIRRGHVGTMEAQTPARRARAVLADLRGRRRKRLIEERDAVVAVLVAAGGALWPWEVARRAGMAQAVTARTALVRARKLCRAVRDADGRWRSI